MELLLIRRSPERSLAGVWQPVTGGIERGESALAAAGREVWVIYKKYLESQER